MTNEMQNKANETKTAVFSTVEQVKVNLTTEPQVKTDKRGIDYVTFGLAKNSKNGPAYANAAIYDPKAMEKAKMLHKGDFVKLYGKTQMLKDVAIFKTFNFKKFERKVVSEEALVG